MVASLLHASVVLAITPLLMAGVSAQAADVYRCTNKVGKIEYRDYPCDASERPPRPPGPAAGPAQSAPPPRSAPPVPIPRDVASLQARIAACLEIQRRIMEQYPAPRCSASDSQCFNRAAAAIEAQVDRMFANPEFQRLDCASLLAPAQNDNSFQVVGVVQGCKYFVAEQRGSLSLVEEWMCFRPSRGDTGTGDISNPGIQEVTLSGNRCNAYVDDWLMSRSRAQEKLSNKCSR